MTTNQLLVTSLEVLLISGIGMVYYRLLLHREQMAHWNRWMLLALSALSLLLPQIRIETPTPWGPGGFAEVMMAPVLISDEGVSGPVYLDWLMMVWLAGMGVSGGIRILHLLRLWSFRRSCGEVVWLEGVPCLFTGGRLGPASFGKWLFWDETINLSPNEQHLILQHEQAHIRQGHSLDRLWMDLLLTVAWWNPAFYWMKRLMIANHETLADRAAMANSSAASYKALMLHKWIRPRLTSTYEFSFSHLQHRIDMLTHHNNPARRWKYALAAPLLLLLTYFGSCHAQNIISIPENGNRLQAETLVQLDVDPVALNLNEVKQRIGYPEEARDAGEQGTVIVKISIDAEGRYIAHEVLTEGRPMLTAVVEANVPLLTFQPGIKDEKPVACSVNVPFNFVLLR